MLRRNVGLRRLDEVEDHAALLQIGRPAEVSVRRRVLRAISLLPRCASSAATCRVTTERATPICCATAEKLPSSATRTNRCMASSRSIVSNSATVICNCPLFHANQKAYSAAIDTRQQHAPNMTCPCPASSSRTAPDLRAAPRRRRRRAETQADACHGRVRRHRQPALADGNGHRRHRRPSETIHDFTGFPDALYAIRYPASGCREGAEVVAAALAAAGLVQLDRQRGLDHGAWVPLRLMYPDADVPVIRFRCAPATPADAFRLGLALAPLTQQGIPRRRLGSLTHNLRDFQNAFQRRRRCRLRARLRRLVHEPSRRRRCRTPCSTTVASAPRQRALTRATSTCCRCSSRLAPAAAAANAERFHSGIDDYVIAMDAYAFRPSQGNNNECPYTRTAKSLHWLMALLLIGLLALGFYMHDLPLSPEKLSSMPGTNGPASAHSCSCWCVWPGHRPSAARPAGGMSRPMQLAAHAGHGLLTC